MRPPCFESTQSSRQLIIHFTNRSICCCTCTLNINGQFCHMRCLRSLLAYVCIMAALTRNIILSVQVWLIFSPGSEKSDALRLLRISRIVRRIGHADSLSSFQLGRSTLKSVRKKVIAVTYRRPLTELHVDETRLGWVVCTMTGSEPTATRLG